MSDQETPEELAGQPVISFSTVADCEAWFAEHSAEHRGFWLQIAKAGAAETVSYAEALDVALCHGRIDGPVPDELAAALAADPQAKVFFETLTGANRYAILYRVQDAKKPETRAARIAKFVEMCRNHETIH